MPATRSRTENWRTLLDTVAERGGALELTVQRPDDPADQAAHAALAPARPDIVWRVRLLRINDTDILVECPSAAGVSLRLKPDTRVLVALSVGQNRWMFHSTVLGGWNGKDQHGRRETLALAMPDRVERCARRAFFRISTGGMNLAAAQCWPLLDPTSALAAEEDNQRAVRVALERRDKGTLAVQPEQTGPMPDVGPAFAAQLLNLSGGGLGLLVPPGSNAFNRHKFYWLRLDLRPDLPEPLALTARLAHTHLDSHQQVYAGLAFDFTFHPAHQRFITDVLAAYLNDLQLRSGERPAVQAA